MSRKLSVLFLIFIAQLLITNSAMANFGYSRLVGNVYVMDNNPAGNKVVVYGRFSNGALRKFGSIDTGGNGAGDNAEADPLGSQESVVISEDKRSLYVVNAGSDNISVFRLTRNGRPILIQVVSSQGDFPVSLTTDGDFLYALNSGSDGVIAGYEVLRSGRLALLEGSVRTLGTGQEGFPEGGLRNLAPGDIAFDTLERRLVIPFGRGPNLGDGVILTFSVNDEGMPSQEAIETPALGRLPFSVDFTANGTALVVEALGLTAGEPTGTSVSSFNFGSGALLEPIGSVGIDTVTSCWVRSAHTTDLVFTSNTGGGSISSLRVSRNGELTLLNNEAASGLGQPTDFDLTDNDRFMYVTTSSDGGVAGYRVNRRTGALRSIGLFPGLPTFAVDGFAPQGMAVR